MKTNYYSFADQTRYDYELKKRWRKGFEFHIEYGSISSLGYKLGYDFSACFNEYVFKKCLTPLKNLFNIKPFYISNTEYY